MLLPVWKPSRYKILYGGRASGKSIAICYFLLTQAIQRKCKVLCTREYQASIKESTYAVFKALIDKHDLYSYFTIKYDSILGVNGSEFIFKGLARDIYSIKSMYDLDYCFVEEAENIDANTWNVLIPTIREAGSEMLIAFNPKDKTSETYQRFVENTPTNAIKIKINYNDIRSFLSKTILDEIENLRINNYSLYEHIYLGEPLDATEDVIFKGRFKIEERDIKQKRGMWEYKGKVVAPLYGIDFGFSTHPLAVVEVFLLDDDTLYISREIYETGLLITKLPARIGSVMPEATKDAFSADSSSPDRIAQLNHEGIKCVGAPKGGSIGSVEAGIDWLLSKNIIIHPNCKNMIYEGYNYKYKIDKNSGKITREIIKENDHLWDAIRYACFKEISASMRRPMKINKNILNQLGIR